MGHKVSRNRFTTAISVSAESGNVISEHLRETNSNGREIAVRDGVRCCRFWFAASIHGVYADSIFNVNVAARLPSPRIQLAFVSLLCEY